MLRRVFILLGGLEVGCGGTQVVRWLPAHSGRLVVDIL